MPRKNLTIVSCSIYAPELEALFKDGRLEYPARLVDSSLHMHPENLQAELQRVVREERACGNSVVLLYGDCSASMAALTAQDGVFRVGGNNCGEILLGKPRYKKLMKEGGFLLFPEWATRWRRILLSFPNMDDELARAMMRDLHTKFVYLNTGIRAVPLKQLEACSEFFGLPFEIVEVPLDHVEGLLNETIALASESEEPKKLDFMPPEDRGSTAFMLLSIAASVLAEPDDTERVITSTSQKLRELSGARTSALVTVGRGAGEDGDYRLLDVTPARRAKLLQTPEATSLIRRALTLSQATILHAPEDGDSKTLGTLYPCLALPLFNGPEQLGVSLSLGLFDIAFADLILEIQEVLSAIVGVILNNALLMESQRRILSDLEQERQRLTYVLEGTNAGAWELNFLTDKLLTNTQDAELLGYSYKPTIDLEEWREHIHPQDIPIRDQAFEKHLKGETDSYECEFRWRRRDDTWIWVLTRGKILRRAADGSPLSLYGTHIDVTKRREADEQIRFMANHDALTGLPSLRLARDRLSVALAAARRSNLQIAVLFIDLNGFKLVNDSYGHDVGDWVLQETAARLTSCIREMDTAARIGGDEFLVLLCDLRTTEEAATVAGRIAESLAEPFIPQGWGEKPALTTGASVGIALFPDHADNEEDLIRLADGAMYTVKRSRKTGYRFAKKAHPKKPKP